MAVRPAPHHTTSHVIAQTLAAYERDASRFLMRWGKPRYKRLLLQFAKKRIPSAPLILADMRALPLRAGSLDGI